MTYLVREIDPPEDPIVEKVSEGKHDIFVYLERRRERARNEI